MLILGGIIFVGGFVIGFYQSMNNSDAKHKARLKVCISNMKLIEACCEMYMVENENAYEITINNLLEKNILKTIPKCYSGGKYQIDLQRIKGRNGKMETFPLVGCNKHNTISEPFLCKDIVK